MAVPPVMPAPQATAGVTVRGEMGGGQGGSVQEGLPLGSGWAQLPCPGGARSHPLSHRPPEDNQLPSLRTQLFSLAFKALRDLGLHFVIPSP